MMPLHDFLFAFYLIIVLPAYSLWKSRRPKPATSSRSTLQGYWRQATFVLPLVCILFLVSWLSGHSPQELGLDIPLSAPGAWGLLAAACLLTVLRVIEKRIERTTSDEDRRKHQAMLRDLPMDMPGTRTETAAYLATTVGMTTCWELLYRGYLLLVLVPLVGTPLAVTLAALSYGAAHGYTSLRQFLGSIIAAFAFTIAYALTGSLWWLIMLHAAAPVTMMYSVRRMQASTASAPC